MVKINTDFITLTQFLKLEDFISTGGEVKFFLSSNKVVVNGEKEDRRGRKLYVNDKIEVCDKVFIIE
ncbi:MAG: S4 domain-containing protein YaaA [Anaerorhabdus sp.]